MVLSLTALNKCCNLATITNAPGGKEMPDITLEDGMKALATCFLKAKGMGVTVAVSVVDARGDLVASARMDDSLWWWTETSRAKAVATVTFGGIPSGELKDRANGPVAQALLHMHQGRMALQQGAVPIKKNKKLVGAIGAAGGSGEEDEEISAAGAEALG